MRHHSCLLLLSFQFSTAFARHPASTIGTNADWSGKAASDTIPASDTTPPAKPVNARDTADFNREKNLSEVIISTRKPAIEMALDKLVLNVSGDLANAGGNLLEIIQKAPGVAVSNEETINMSGKSGVTILVDGRPVQLAGKDLVNYLRSIPAAQVDRIEIISNPSARYDAQGNAGIINIRMKRVTVQGFNGSLGAGWTQSVHSRQNLTGLFNIRNGRWNFNLAGGAGRAHQFTNGNITRKVGSQSDPKIFTNNTTDQDGSESYNAQVSADWFVSARHSFGAIAKINHYRNPMFTPGVTLIGSAGQTDSSLQTINDNLTGNDRFNYNLNYKYEDTLGTVLNIDADNIFFRNNNSSLVSTNLLDAGGSKYGFTANDQRVRTRINVYSIKADYSTKIKNPGISVESGIKWNSTRTVNDLAASLFRDNQMVTDTGRSNNFHYRETMLAAYFSASFSIGKWEYQAGLRGEHTTIRGRSVDLDNNRLNYPDSSYFNLFPTVFIRYRISDNKSVGLSYSRRLNRPTYQDLNPFQYIFDNYTRESGNPYLQPEFSQRVELTVAPGSSFTITAGVSRTTNLMESISTQSGDITTESDYNIGTANQLYANLSYNRQLFSWWNIYANLSPFFRKYDAAVTAGRIDISTTGMGWYASNTFTTGRDWKFQLSSWGNLATRDGIYNTSALGSVDLGIGKTLAKKKLTIQLSGLDLFNTQRWRQKVDFADVRFVYLRKWESRAFRIQLSWKFGKTSYRQRNRTTASAEEMERIKEK
ncbi:MAG: TonB-dependent receptor [Chitinophagaceae bacterium]|nr:MAG: TonB-dependent receptor [Chitinophagaceae bacterium]